MTFEDIVQEISQLSIEQRKMLITLIADSLAEPIKTRSLLELEGLGEHLWQGIEAQEHVESMRREWDDRS